MRFRLCAVALVILGCVGSAGWAPVAYAQNSKIEADFKGAVGLGLVGAELGAVIPALVGVEATWAYIAFPVLGAAGGGLAGYFLLDKADHVGLSIVALTAGMALVLPALITTLQLTSYDDTDQEQPAASPFAHKRERRARKLLAAGPGMLRVSEGRLALAAPGVALVPGLQGSRSVVSGMSLALMSGQF